MGIKPRIICHVGFVSCFFLELLSLFLLVVNNAGPCEQAAGLSHAVNVTSTIFVLLLDLVCASMVLKLDSNSEIDPTAVIVNAWSSLVCTGAGLAIIFVVLYRCSGPTLIILLSGTLLIVSGIIHVLNAIYSYHKA